MGKTLDVLRETVAVKALDGATIRAWSARRRSCSKLP
jgi:hypothetical protein